MKSRKKNRKRKSKSPNFDSGVIPEPLLLFGGRHEHVDPKVGLGLYGPYSLAGQPKPSVTSLIVGIVGTPAMIADAQQWLDACSGVITNDGQQPYLYPHFPGFNENHPFQCKLIHGDTWQEIIKYDDLNKALITANYYDRIRDVVSLYIRSIEILAQRDPRPDVILCCIPEDVIELCTVAITKTGATQRVKKSKSEKEAEKIAQTGQIFMFPEMDPYSSMDDEAGHHNLRRGIKAEAMQYGIPTQLVWPRTLELSSDSAKAQDAATRAWNFTSGLYYKAGGFPWRLADTEPGICFVGVSFFKEINETNPKMRTSMAQAFTSAGDGYVLRGRPFEWSDRHGRSPHIDSKGASSLISDVLDMYKKQNRGSLPSRLVVHKSSRYWEEELEGFKEGSSTVPRVDFVALGWRGIQFYRIGEYPPIRGTYIKFSPTEMALYTNGYIPFLRTYPGPRVPKPLEIMEHYGDSPWNVILKEIMALTKMNWNTAGFSTGEPITIAFSRKVGHVLAELPENLPLRPEYRFYM